MVERGARNKGAMGSQVKERWFLYYDGACPLCTRLKTGIEHMMSGTVKFTMVDLGGTIAKSKGYDKSNIVLETPAGSFFGSNAIREISSKFKIKGNIITITAIFVYSIVRLWKK